MDDGIPTLYVGTRVPLVTGDVIAPIDGFVPCTRNLDGAIWAAELAEGEGGPRVYEVAATGAVENVEGRPGDAPSPHPVMSWRSREPLRVLREITDWTHYHGTRARFRPGEVIEPGHTANYGARPRVANFVYFTRTLGRGLAASAVPHVAVRPTVRG